MTEKEKMVKILKKAFKDCCQHLKCRECVHFAYGGDACLFYKYADALLGAGIGDISKSEIRKYQNDRAILEKECHAKYCELEECKHRIDIAELALYNKCKEIVKFGFSTENEVDCFNIALRQAKEEINQNG